MLQHQHLIVRAEVNKPPTDVEAINKWLIELVDMLKMKIMIGPFAAYCENPENQGLTAGCIIETSHIMMHCWDKESPGLMQLDIYTCSKLPLQMMLFALEEFDPVKVEYKILDRETCLKDVSDGPDYIT
jgi:S-adenosylmethionine/arginine decarboxylase-like enzyme